MKVFRLFIKIVTLPLLMLSMFGCSAERFPFGRYTTDTEDFVLELTPTGEFSIYEYGNRVTIGTYTVQGNKLTWETDTFCDSNGFGKATYTWSYDNGTLLFQVQGEDQCEGRITVLDGRPYQIEE